MIIGNPSHFAIESEITSAYEERGQMALGFFVIHILGHQYGVRGPNATMLAASFDEVGRRIARRGSHKLLTPAAEAKAIALAFRRVCYEGAEEGEMLLGKDASNLRNAINSNHLAWAPDGDEAFDDGSYVLQLDEKNQVRLIAFVGTEDFRYDPASLRELWLPQDDFYGILQDWRRHFEAEWKFLS